MVIRCPQCHHSRSVGENRIPPRAEVATCPVCGCRFRFRNLHPRSDGDDASAKQPPASAGATEQREARADRPARLPDDPTLSPTPAGNTPERIAPLRAPADERPPLLKETLRPRAGREDSTPPAPEAVPRAPVARPATEDGGDVWEAVARLDELWRQPAGPPEDGGTARTLRGPADAFPERAGPLTAGAPHRAVPELRNHPDKGAVPSTHAGEPPPDRPPLFRRFFERGKKTDRTPAATLEIMLPGLTDDKSTGDKSSSNGTADVGRAGAPASGPHLGPAGGVVGREDKNASGRASGAAYTPATYSLPQQSQGPWLPPAGPGIRERATQAQTGPETRKKAPAEPVRSPLPDAPPDVEPYDDKRDLPHFLYSEEGPDPEARVEQDIRMLKDPRSYAPLRDLGRLREFAEEQPDEGRAGDGGAGGVPWENPALYGWLGGFMASLRGVMFKGPEFFSCMGNEGSPAPGYLFFVLTGYICIFGSLAWRLAAEVLLPGVLPLPAGRAILPVLLLLAPAALGLMLLFVVGCIRIVLRVFAPDRAAFIPVYKVVSYSSAPFVLCVVPFIGPPLGAIWFLVSLVTGCRCALGLPWPLALLAPLPPALLMLGTVVACFI